MGKKIHNRRDPLQKYSQYGSSTTTEASKAFVHLVKWFQPNGSLLLAWLRRIYTPHLCLIRWAFSSNDIASYIGSYMVSTRLSLSFSLSTYSHTRTYKEREKDGREQCHMCTLASHFRVLALHLLKAMPESIAFSFPSIRNEKKTILV